MDEQPISVTEMLLRWFEGEPVASIHPRAEDALRQMVRETVEAHSGLIAAIGQAARDLEEMALAQHDAEMPTAYMRGHVLGMARGLFVAVRVLIRNYQWSDSRVARG